MFNASLRIRQVFLQTVNGPCCSAGTVLLSLLREERLELLELPEGKVAAPGSRSLKDASTFN